jgi:hypothetical protein
MKTVFWDNHYFSCDFQKYFNAEQWIATDDLEKFQTIESSYKLAMIGRIHLIIDKQERGIIDQLLLICDKVIIFDNDLTTRHVEAILEYNHPKITWVMPGNIYGIDNNIFNNQYLRSMIEMYGRPQIKPDLEELRPYDTKPYFFDALLGRYKPHRDYVVEQINKDQNADKIFLRYGHSNFVLPSNFTEVGQHDQMALGPPGYVVDYKGHGCPLAFVILLDIYNITAYSIICETEWNNTHFFITEKTAKCLLARRLFVVFCGQYWLRSFKGLGFKTFDCIIDESYDNIEDPHTRWSAGYEQVKYLCTLDQQMVLDKIRPILEHNYELMWSTDWRGILDRQVLGQIEL